MGGGFVAGELGRLCGPRRVCGRPGCAALGAALSPDSFSIFTVVCGGFARRSYLSRLVAVQACRWRSATRGRRSANATDASLTHATPLEPDAIMLQSCWGVAACPPSVNTLQDVLRGSGSCECISVTTGEERFHERLMAALSSRRPPTDAERQQVARAAPRFASPGRKRTIIDSDYFQLVFGLLNHLTAGSEPALPSHTSPHPDVAGSSPARHWLEFGVFEGRSANLTCGTLAVAGHHRARVVGFDTFTG